MSVLFQLPVNELGVLLVLCNCNQALLTSLLLHMLHELLLHFMSLLYIDSPSKCGKLKNNLRGCNKHVILPLKHLKNNKKLTKQSFTTGKSITMGSTVSLIKNRSKKHFLYRVVS